MSAVSAERQRSCGGNADAFSGSDDTLKAEWTQADENMA